MQCNQLSYIPNTQGYVKKALLRMYKSKPKCDTQSHWFPPRPRWSVRPVPRVRTPIPTGSQIQSDWFPDTVPLVPTLLCSIPTGFILKYHQLIDKCNYTRVVLFWYACSNAVLFTTLWCFQMASDVGTLWLPLIGVLWRHPLTSWRHSMTSNCDVRVKFIRISRQ